MDLTLPSAPAGDLVRRTLLARVLAARPAIVSLVAPAGFGKTTLVGQFLPRFPASAVCDCAGVASAGDFVRRLLPALAQEDPTRGPELARAETVAGDGAADDERGRLALEAWRRACGPAAFVIENAEGVADAESRDLLARLLAARPEGRTVVICSREPLRLHLSRFAPPHRILTLRANDLAFTRDEIEEILRPCGVRAESIDRVAAISAGWPVAVLLLARFAQEGRLDGLLDALGDVAYEELYEYLADHVLATLPLAVTDGLSACAAIPHARERDVRLALGDGVAFDTFLAFAKTSPFVRRGDDGAFVVHPLVASSLLARAPERIDPLLRAAARAYASGGEYQRAAEIDLARGDGASAADALERVGVLDGEAPPLAYARVLAALDRNVILRHPRLWSVTALLRAFTVDARLLLDEVETIWTELAPDAAANVRVPLFVFRALMLADVGEYERGLALVDEMRAQIAAPPVPETALHAVLLYLRSLLLARLGRTVEAERGFALAWPFVADTNVLEGGTHAASGADIARVRGDRAAERERLERAIEAGRSSRLDNFSAYYCAEAALGAWLAGEEAAFAQHAFALRSTVEREGIRAFAFFAAAACGDDAQPGRHDHAKWIAAGHLIAAANAPGGQRALEHAQAAREAAAAHRSPFMQVLAALAAAEFDDGRRRALHDEAVALAEAVDAPELHAALDAIVRGGSGSFLEPFVQRYRRAERATAREASLTIEVVRGTVLRGGEPVSLPEREHALVTAIALRRDAVPRERLTDLLWPDLADAAARNAFHVCLHRMKSRLGDPNVVVRTNEGYRLGNGVRVDVWEIERTVRAARGTERLDALAGAALREVYERLRGDRPARFAAWEWFEPTERHLRELRAEVAGILAQDALRARRYGEVLALCQEMIAYDPCDEPARELTIRAYIGRGDRAAALRHFRQYREVLMTELQCEPSPSLAALVGAST